MRLLCKLGRHDYRSILRTYDVFSTSWTDTKTKDYWTAHFLECKHCKRRNFITNYPYPASPHAGIDRAKHRWLDYGTISDAVQNHEKYSKPEPSKENDRLSLDSKTAKIVLKALSTHSEQEALACLRQARKLYENKVS